MKFIIAIAFSIASVSGFAQTNSLKCIEETREKILEIKTISRYEMSQYQIIMTSKDEAEIVKAEQALDQLTVNIFGIVGEACEVEDKH